MKDRSAPSEKGEANAGDSTSKASDDSAGRYAYEGLDRALHEKARLGIMMALAAAPDGLLFAELKSLCTLTDGNLNRHLKVLVEAGLMEIWKGKENQRSKTLGRITRAGRERFTAYLAELEKVLRDARGK